MSQCVRAGASNRGRTSAGTIGQFEHARLDVLWTVAEALANFNGEAVRAVCRDCSVHAIASAGVQFDTEQADVHALAHRLIHLCNVLSVTDSFIQPKVNYLRDYNLSVIKGD